MKVREPDPVKPVLSLFTADKTLFREIIKRLEKEWGPADLASGLLDFSSTDYYEEEFGAGLKRKFFSFERLIAPYELAGLKTFSNSLEAEFSKDGKRLVNIDPGYMALEKFVLASCKNFTHRICVGRGVYADLTFMYTGDAFKALEWTYPDYKAEDVVSFLKEARKRLAKQLGKGF